MIEAEESIAELRSRLFGMVKTTEWQGIVVPALRAKLRLLERNIACNHFLELEDLRYKQGAYAVVQQLLERPLDMLDWLEQMERR